MASISIVAQPPGLLSSIFESVNVRELYNFQNLPFSSTLTLGENEIQLTTIKYRIIDGILPNNLSLSDEDNCLITGTVIDIDTNEVYSPCAVELQITGEGYAQCYSALEGYHDFNITIEAYCTIENTLTLEETEITTSQVNTIRVVNNYSSDRDQFIRDYTEKFGTLNKNNEKVLFTINGTPSTAEDYLTYQKSIGNFPLLSNV